MSVSNVRLALIDKTQWSKQKLSAHVKRLQANTPMSTMTAQAVLAHLRGVKIARFLNDEDLAVVHRVLPLVKSESLPPKSPKQSRSRVRKRSASPMRSPRRIVFPNKFELEDCLLPEAKLREAREMATVYPLLYVLENSMRVLITRVLAAKYGKDWWELVLTSAKARQVREKADHRRLQEDHKRWHQRRGSRPIDYTELGDLATIILAKQDDFFPDVLGDSRKWFEAFMEELDPSRHVICHMNPLNSENARLLEIRAIQWKKLLEVSKANIPGQTPEG